MSLPLARLPQNPAFVVRGNPDRPVHARQWFERPGRGDGRPETWIYADRLSAAPGEAVTVHAISTAPEIEVEVWSDGLKPVRLSRTAPVAVRWAETPEDASVVGCGWPAVAEIRVGSDWPSGVHRILARIPGSHDGGAEHLLVVRPQPRGPADRLLLLTSDRTWCAYNDWGGSNHYEGVVDPRTARFAPRLSALRPLARGFVSLPSGAPRTLPDRPAAPGAPVRYPHMEWAWATGHSKKYASAGWPTYERPFAHWAEAQGFPLAVATQLDLHRAPEILDRAACLAIVGHDEYWTWQMRDAVDSWVARGGRIARFAGNFFWQIRLEDEGRTQVCHKYLAHGEDPLRDGPDAHLTTSLWEDPLVGRPGRASFGLDGSRGVYAGWGGLAPQGAGGFTLYRPGHWAFSGTGLGYGDVLGGAARVLGYEVDGLDHRVVDGLPVPEPQAHLPDDLEILALAPARLRETGGEPSDLFVGDEDARFVARVLLGRDDETALARVDRGSAMIVAFSRGRGEVFHAGTTEWVAGLIRRDPAIEHVTRTVIARFLRG